MRYYVFGCELNHNGTRYPAGARVPAEGAEAIELEKLGGLFVGEDTPESKTEPAETKPTPKKETTTRKTTAKKK